MHRLKDFLSFGRVRNKFLYISLAIGIIPLIVVGSASFVVATRSMRSSSVQLYANNLDISNNIVDLLSRNIESLARSVLGNQTIQSCMEDSNGQGSYPSAQVIQQIDSLIAELIPDSTQFSSLFLLSEEGFRYQYTPFTHSAANLWGIRFSDIAEQDWYLDTLQADGRECYFLYDVLGDYAIQQTATNCISTTKLLKDTRTGEPYGVLVINVQLDYYRDVYPAAIQSADSSYLLADEKSGAIGYIGLQAGSDKGVREALASYPDSLEADGYTITRVHNPRTGWDLIHVIANRDLLAQGFTIPLITTLVILTLIVLSVICSVIAANTITRPLEQLKSLMDHMEHTGTCPVLHFPDDEIGRIGDRFQMVVRQNEQLNQKIIKLSVLEKEAELNALQAQINPHFFYNTLATMYWLAKFGKNADVAEMAIALSDIFKIALKRGSDMITVETELEHIKKYISIQNVRYQNRIQFQLEVEEAMKPKKMLKLLLQPLVENAIYHGLETKTGSWELVVTGKLEDGSMVFTVADNGVGMVVAESVTQGLGIQNVTERIRLKYGEAYGCRFESAPGQGTRVTVIIPDCGE